MQCNGKPIIWKHLEDLYIKDTSKAQVWAYTSFKLFKNEGGFGSTGMVAFICISMGRMSYHNSLTFRAYTLDNKSL